MPRWARATIASATVAAALVAFVATLADPIGDGLQTLAPHRLSAAGVLVLAVASAMALGIAIGRGRCGDAGSSATAAAALPPVEPLTVRARTDMMTRAETEFLANMSHELRTPLNAVIGFAELILGEVHGPMSDRRYGKYVSHIRDAGEQLLAIVNATLDLSQLAAGRLELQPRRVDPREIVEDCALSVAAQAEAAKVELVVRPSTTPPVSADPARLKQALINLLSNAIEFTAQGGRVSIGAAAHDTVVVFEVADTGVGMTPDQIEIALQPFRVIDSCMTRRHGGIGLGLTLADRLVRLQGGELRIHSRPGCGTAVTAILPAGGFRQTGEG